MFALFVSLECNPPRDAFEDLTGPSGIGVAVFNTEADAITAAVRRLVDAGVLRQESGGYYDSIGKQAGITEAEALNEWQNWLGASEFVHVYEVADRRCLQVIDDPLLVIRQAVCEAIVERGLVIEKRFVDRVIDNLPDVFRQPLQGVSECE